MIQRKRSVAMPGNSATVPELPAAGRRARRKTRVFMVLNALMMLLVIVGAAGNQNANAFSGAFVALLFLICSAPFMFITGYRGKASLLIMFLAYYFATFALSDLVSLFSAEPMYARDGGSFTRGELVIITGAFFVIVGYLSVITFRKKEGAGLLQREWSPRWIALGGLLAWVIGFYVTAVWQFGVLDTYSGAKVNPLIGGFVSLIRFLQPVGTLLLIYLYLTSRKKTILYVLLATMIADFGLGFFGDSKELAIRAPILLVVGYMLLRERLPVVGFVLFAVFAAIAFNFFAAYRLDVQLRHESRADAFRGFGSRVDQIVDSDTSLLERFQSGGEYFVQRVSLKQNVELLVSRAGDEVDFLYGETLVPLLYAFIPRFVAPNKPDSSQAGRIFNQRFGLSGERTTFISMSQLGELYWNFGWPGLVIGMSLIGVFLGWLASVLRLDSNPTAIKFLLLLITIYFLVLRFEGAIAMTYIVWARLAVLLLVIHFFMPKVHRAVSNVQMPRQGGIA